MEPAAENCNSCRFARGSFQPNGNLWCHRNPPTIGGWPHVEQSDWCGEFARRGAPETRVIKNVRIMSVGPVLDSPFQPEDKA